MRVVTTLPSVTELVATLGLTPVGVSHECDYPPAVTELPTVTDSRVDATASSGEIDRQVLEVGEEGVYEVDLATLDRLDPDLIVTQAMCDVCAVDEGVVREAVTRIDADPQILTTDPHCVADVFDDLERIGRATGREERARTVRRDLEARIEAVSEQTAAIPAAEVPTVAIFDWTDPVMVAGHWTAELVAWAGGEYPLAAVGDRSRPREWTAIRAADPDVLVVAPCGFDLAQTAENRIDLTDRPGWDDLSAVETGRVWAMDGHHLLNRPGPRLVDTLAVLARLLHPTRFDDDLEASISSNPFDAFETPSKPLRAFARPFADTARRLEP